MPRAEGALEAYAMNGNCKTLRALLLPCLLLAALVMTTGPGDALITQGERDACKSGKRSCSYGCADKAVECGPAGSKGWNTCFGDCDGICELRESDCLRDADKDYVKPNKPLPKLQQETPRTKGIPKGNIQQVE